MWYADIWDEAVGGRVDVFAASVPVLVFINSMISLIFLLFLDGRFFVFQKPPSGLLIKLKITNLMEPVVANGHSTDSDVLGE